MSTAPSPSQELPVSHLPSSPSQLLTSPSIESVVAPATASCPPAPGNLKDLLCHSDILLDCHEWFHLLQDDGIEMSSTNKETYLPMNLKPKKKTQMIVHSSADGAFLLAAISIGSSVV